MCSRTVLILFSPFTSPCNLSLPRLSHPTFYQLPLLAFQYQRASSHSIPGMLVPGVHAITESLGSSLSSQGSFSLVSPSSSTTTSVSLSCHSTPHATNPRSISSSTSPKCNIISSASLTATTHTPKPTSTPTTTSTTSILFNFSPSHQEVPPPASTHSPRIRNLQIVPKRLWTWRSEDQQNIKCSPTHAFTNWNCGEIASHEIQNTE